MVFLTPKQPSGQNIATSFTTLLSILVLASLTWLCITCLPQQTMKLSLVNAEFFHMAGYILGLVFGLIKDEAAENCDCHKVTVTPFCSHSPLLSRQVHPQKPVHWVFQRPLLGSCANGSVRFQNNLWSTHSNKKSPLEQPSNGAIPDASLTSTGHCCLCAAWIW